MNPFFVTNRPVDEANDLYGREELVKQIKERVNTKTHTAIFGVEGVGKTSLLNSAFTLDYRIEKAKENILITSVTKFPTNLAQDDIYTHFIGLIRSEARLLSRCGVEGMEDILAICENELKDQATKEGAYDKIVTNIFQEKHYRIVFVVDDFECFTSSMDITMKHHEILRRLMDKTQYIVATNYDFSEDSLPRQVGGSFFLMQFGGNEIPVDGWTCEQTAGYIRSILQENAIQFSDALIERIHKASGGIPYLVQKVAQFAYDHLEKDPSDQDFKLFPLYEDEQVQKVMSHWCKMLSKQQMVSLRQLANSQQPTTSEEHAALRSLRLRGMLKELTKNVGHGHEIKEDNKYQFGNQYLKKFCNDPGKLEEAVSHNPLLNDTSMSLKDLLAQVREKIGSGAVKEKEIADVAIMLCGYLPEDMTRPVDMSEQMTEEQLAPYCVSMAMYNKLDQRVQNFIRLGVLTCRTFENVSDPNFDFAICYLPFCKAVELHINLTLVAVMERLVPNARPNPGDAPLRSELQSVRRKGETMMMGPIIHYLTSHSPGISHRAIDDLVAYCTNRGQLTNYDRNWWNGVLADLKTIKGIRNNDVPHTKDMCYSRGVDLLKALFEYDTDPDTAFVQRCMSLYEDVMGTSQP